MGVPLLLPAELAPFLPFLSTEYSSSCAYYAASDAEATIAAASAASSSGVFFLMYPNNSFTSSSESKSQLCFVPYSKLNSSVKSFLLPNWMWICGGLKWYMAFNGA